MSGVQTIPEAPWTQGVYTRGKNVLNTKGNVFNDEMFDTSSHIPWVSTICDLDLEAQYRYLSTLQSGETEYSEEIQTKLAAARRDAEGLRDKIKRNQDFLVDRPLLSLRNLPPEPDASLKTDMQTLKKASVIAAEAEHSLTQRFKIKQGLPGFLNGRTVSALADTGSGKNVMSASYAERLGLEVTGSSHTFELGNSRKIRSSGIVSVRWSFDDNPKKRVPIICHVLPNCVYDLILGNGFLRATATLVRYRHRLTQCLFPLTSNFAHFGFLGEKQRLRGTIGDVFDVLAVADTGAERNVMDMDFALKTGLNIRKSKEYREYLQFADGTYEETVGRVETHWTFASGKRVPMTFEVLENCCSDVIIGEEMLSRYNVFEKYDSSMVTIPNETDVYELASFDFIRTWQRPLEELSHKLHLNQRRSDRRSRRDGSTTVRNPQDDARAEEQRRLDAWNFKYNFGASASPEEKELEKSRRMRYASGGGADVVDQRGDALSRSQHAATSPSSPRVPMVPSIATSQSRR